MGLSVRRYLWHLLAAPVAPQLASFGQKQVRIGCCRYRRSLQRLASPSRFLDEARPLNETPRLHRRFFLATVSSAILQLQTLLIVALGGSHSPSCDATRDACPLRSEHAVLGRSSVAFAGACSNLSAYLALLLCREIAVAAAVAAPVAVGFSSRFEQRRIISRRGRSCSDRPRAKAAGHLDSDYACLFDLL